MKSGSINLEETVYIPTEGFVVSPKGVITFELYSADVSDSIDVELQGSLSHNHWDTLQENGVDITMSLVQGEALVRSFNVDKNISLRLKCGTATGSVSYLIAE